MYMYPLFGKIHPPLTHLASAIGKLHIFFASFDCVFCPSISSHIAEMQCIETVGGLWDDFPSWLYSTKNFATKG